MLYRNNVVKISISSATSLFGHQLKLLNRTVQRTFIIKFHKLKRIPNQTSIWNISTTRLQARINPI